jgi:hypothetical protein
MPRPVTVNRETAYQSKLQVSTVRSRDALTPVAADAKASAPAGKGEAVKNDSEAVRGNIAGGKQFAQKAAAPAAVAPTIDATTRSTDQLAQQIQAQEKEVPTTDAADQRQIAQQPQFGQQVIAAVARQPRYIVARGLTQQQIVDLNGCLNVQNNGRIANYRRSGSEILPTTIPLNVMLKTSFASTSPSSPRSQFAMETATPVASPPVEPPRAIRGGGTGTQKQLDDGKLKREPATQPTGTSATTQFVGGTIGGAVVTAAPTTSPSVFVAASSQPVAANTIAAIASPATQMSASSAATLPATTAPAVAIRTSPTTNPAEERLDVVIVVKPDPSAQINPVAGVPTSPADAPNSAPDATQPDATPNSTREKAAAK